MNDVNRIIPERNEEIATLAAAATRMWGDAEISRLLFEARQVIEMFADLSEMGTGRAATHERDLVKRIDDFRQARGWNLHGYGGEDDADQVYRDISASLADILRRHEAYYKATGSGHWGGDHSACDPLQCAEVGNG